MLIKAAQLFLSLSILVIIHEFGHFFFARLFKTRVEKFYLFFDFLFPIPTILNFALFKKKVGDTEYGIGWFPLGGYVKIAGMADESMDDSYLNSEPLPDEYRSKKNYQKLFIMLGGIIFNIILGWLIYSMIALAGESYLPAENAVYGISCDSLGLYAGFKDGDIIQSHDGGKKFESFGTIPKELLLDNVEKVEVLREGKPFTVVIPNDFVARAVATRAKGFIDFRIPCMVGDFSEETVIKGKLQKGDVIVAINDSAVHYFQEARGILANLKGQDVTIKYIRAKDTLTTSAKVPATGLLGFRPPSGNDMHYYNGYLNLVETKYSFLQAFPKGAEIAYHKLVDYLKQFKLIFSPEVKGYKQIGGIGTIGSIFPATWDWLAFWQLTAFLSLMLAVMNLLPIPMLDGGYVILLLFEMITRIKLSDKSVEYINRVGFVLVIALMLYANGMDIFRAFFEK